MVCTILNGGPEYEWKWGDGWYYLKYPDKTYLDDYKLVDGDYKTEPKVQGPNEFLEKHPRLSHINLP